MQKLRLAGSLLLPSLGSLVTSFILAGLFIGLSAWAHFARGGRIYSILYGENSAPELIEKSRSTVEAFSNTVFGNPTLNKVLFFVFWLIIGLIVYTIFTGLGKYLSELKDVVVESRYVNAPRGATRQHMIIRLLLRLIGISLVFVYFVFFYNIFLPFAILCSRISFSELPNLNGWMYAGLAVAELMLSLHIMLILLRFTALRPRLFGGASADEATIDDVEEHRVKSH